MTAPVVGFNAEVGTHADGDFAFIEVTPTDDGLRIEIRIERANQHPQFDDDVMIVTMDEARQIIAGLASVIE